tara:strand:+ start:101 stop:343 length:243 start_codon:yes stop_codon:yes gene_type:complete
MSKVKRKVIPFRDLNENQKKEILSYIRTEEISIKKASFIFDVTVDTINRIFSQKYGKRTGYSEEKRKEKLREYWNKRKFN